MTAAAAAGSTLNLTSGEVVNPDVGKALTMSAGTVIDELATRVRTAIATATSKNLGGPRIAELNEFVNLLTAARSKCSAVESGFDDDISVRDHARAAGSGTDGNYLA